MDPTLWTACNGFSLQVTFGAFKIYNVQVFPVQLRHGFELKFFGRHQSISMPKHSSISDSENHSVKILLFVYAREFGGFRVKNWSNFGEN